MSENHVPAIDETIHKSNVWLKDLQQSLGGQERRQAYVALRAVLHALRDRIHVDEAAQLAAQMPMLIRGVFYEGWDPSDKPLKYRHKKEFLEQISRDAPAIKEEEIERTVTAVFELLDDKISDGETDQVHSLLPAEVRELWPKPGL